MNLLRFVMLCLGLLVGAVALGQQRADVDVAKRALLPISKGPTFDHTSTKEDAHLGQKLAAGAFSVYKKCISSQDYRRCTFTLSCSEYALRSVQQHRILLGTLMGLDRYSRCHGMHGSFYATDLKSERSIDPVTK